MNGYFHIHIIPIEQKIMDNKTITLAIKKKSIESKTELEKMWTPKEVPDTYIAYIDFGDVVINGIIPEYMMGCWSLEWHGNDQYTIIFTLDEKLKQNYLKTNQKVNPKTSNKDLIKMIGEEIVQSIRKKIEG